MCDQLISFQKINIIDKKIKLKSCFIDDFDKKKVYSSFTSVLSVHVMANYWFVEKMTSLT